MVGWKCPKFIPPEPNTPQFNEVLFLKQHKGSQGGYQKIIMSLRTRNLGILVLEYIKVMPDL